MTEPVITCTPIFPAEFSGGKNPTWTLKYKIDAAAGATDANVQAALGSQSAATYGGLSRDTYGAKEESNGLWLGEVRYCESSLQMRPQPVGSVRHSFSTGGGSQHITQSLRTRNSY